MIVWLAARRPGNRHDPGQWGLPAGRALSVRLLTLAASVAWRHVADDPVRALVLAGRVLPGRSRGLIRLAGRYGRAVTLWGEGDRDGALHALASRPRQLARFALAVDMPEAAAPALAGLGADDRARPALTARLAWREGRCPTWPPRSTRRGAVRPGCCAHAARGTAARRRRRGSPHKPRPESASCRTPRRLSTFMAMGTEAGSGRLR